MSNKVFANTREISCKAAAGKSICSFPDVCLSPPSPPAGPVPIPYPNTAFASDATSGSKNVKISGKEIMLKNKSYFKKSTGDEAATKSLGMGVVTHQIQGKVYFVSWSMDVKVEGQNACRHLDMTTHNHMSPTPNTGPWPYADTQAIANISECDGDAGEAKTKCAGQKGPPKCTEACRKAQKCVLVKKSDDKKACCEHETTGHHLVEVHCFSPTGERGGSLEDLESYNQNAAPCVCASQSRADGSHGVLHAVQGQLEGAHNSKPGEPNCEWEDAGGKIKGKKKRANAVSKWTYSEARDAGAKAHKIAFPNCNEDCIKKQLDAYHKDECGLDDDTPLRSDPGAPNRSAGKLSKKQQQQVDDAVDAIRGVGNSSSSV
jgi:hypothetical protein